VLIVMKIVGWAQWLSSGSLRLGMGVGQLLCSWLVAAVDLWEGGQMSKHHWKTVSRMASRVACGSVLLVKSLMSLSKSVVQVVVQMAYVRAQAGLEERSGIVEDVDWKLLHLCWWLAKLVVPPRKKEGQVRQQQVHPIELRRLGGSLRKMLACSCCNVQLECLKAYRSIR
jgi:hypothetical protein